MRSIPPLTEIAAKVPSSRIPGEPGIWVLVFGDLLVFAIFFSTFAYYRIAEPAIFHASQAALNQPLGLANTLLLLTSSLLVVKAIEAGRAGHGSAARGWTLAAFFLGLGFVVLKAVEYSQKVGESLYPGTNDFFMLYYVLTAIHLLHVVAGLGLLAFLRVRFSRITAGRDAIAECCAIYWHMVDIIWVVLFAIFYMHR